MKQQIKILSLGIILGGLFVGNFATSQTFRLNPIKPIAGSKQQITDEQQAILAVRTGKASVVNILGKRPATNKNVINLNAAAPVSGTGFVWDKSGIIITNNHVVEDRQMEYFIVTAEGAEYPLTILGYDLFDDIAVLKTSMPNLIPAKLGDSDALETGQSVFAIGNSLGIYEDSVTRGVISGLGRSIQENQRFGLPQTHNWIQTDAAISPGNSGGPLINLMGEVVGMNTLIDVSGQSLSFAVPINTIKDAVNQIKTFGMVSRPYVGIQFATINPEVKAKMNLTVNQGAVIVSVNGQPAKDSGLLVGDIITEIGGNVLTNKNTLDKVIQKYQAGNQVIFKVLRGNQSLDKTVILGQFQNK
jgi:serine protease Do